MKQLLRTLLFIFVFVCCVAASSQPRLVLPKVSYDFSSVTEGEIVKASFELRNEGSAPLEIKKVFPACGCTVAELSSNTVAPGQSETLKVNFDTDGFYGFKVKTIRVFTNDPNRSTVVLSLQGKVEREVELEPSRMYFGTAIKGTDKIVKTDVKVSEGVQVKEIISRSKYVLITQEEIDQQGEKVTRVKARLSEDIPVGTFRNRIVVKTTSSKNPVLNIPVFARVEGDLKFNPSDVSFGLMEGPLKADQSKIVSIENRSAKPIKILSTKSSSASVSTELEVLKEGFLYQLKIIILSSTTGIIRDKIAIETDHQDGDQRVLELSVYGIISN